MILVAVECRAWDHGSQSGHDDHSAGRPFWEIPQLTPHFESRDRKKQQGRKCEKVVRCRRKLGVRPCFVQSKMLMSSPGGTNVDAGVPQEGAKKKKQSICLYVARRGLSKGTCRRIEEKASK